MRAADITLVILDGRTAALRLAQPCACGRQRCALGQHILQATRDMTPGPRAQSFEPASTNGNASSPDHDPAPDPTLTIDAEFAALLHIYWNAARNLSRAIDRLRPDRWVPLPDPATDADWCRNHLDIAGICEPRYSGDECRKCNELRRTYGHLPDYDLMRARETWGHWRDRDIIEWRARLPKTKKRKQAS